jgi:hypothetical protein
MKPSQTPVTTEVLPIDFPYLNAAARVELAKDPLFDGQLLVHRFDDEIASGQRAVRIAG